jgi:hypothetical protein
MNDPRPAGWRGSAALTGLLLVEFIAVADVSIMLVVLPNVARDLHAGAQPFALSVMLYAWLFATVLTYVARSTVYRAFERSRAVATSPVAGTVAL